jgi:hypothetical protein
MYETIKFIKYEFLSTDDIDIEWIQSLPQHLDNDDIILDAGYDPEDSNIFLGVLLSQWCGHEPGCLLVSNGELTVNKRFAISEKPLVVSNVEL